MATRLTRLVTNLRLFDHMAPLFNLIVSNVPGPDFPLYLAGARMVAMYPVGPIIEGVGVNVTVFSYLDTMYVGVQGCWDLVPDIDVMAEGMESLAGRVAGRGQPPGPTGAVVARRTACVIGSAGDRPGRCAGTVAAGLARAGSLGQRSAGPCC